ncbi:hypothetical protein [Natrinema sp. 1APR25-10V2]|uniref:hypothetical protein n=1 Tax=Natrinema sp. 1APR25-10V2 TaxID=2951081 RepID=UPI0028758520|nr:hypothetical protein [Natrinema sp. 1APR25-10V2]MDS0477603.1 hypothetical protein [Natrinema sp. 1APR25-10V2]
MVYAPDAGPSIDDGDDDGRAATFLPESDAALLSVIDELDTPVTVDEIADTLIEPARPSIETWATVHERLHRDRLPALDASGAIAFDETHGLVERTAHSSDGGRFSGTLLAALSLGFLLIAIGLVSISVLIA